MATLTYDPTETQEGELTEDEKDSLAVGEKLAEQEQELLAGKFKDAEELEKGYIELQKKLGEPKEETSEEKPEAKETKEDEKVDTSFLDTLWDEATKDNFSKDTLDKLSNMDSKEIAQMYLQSRAQQPESAAAELTQENVTALQGIPGGKEEYGNMMQWAGKTLEKGEVEMFDAIMDRGDPLAAFFAVQALTYRYNDSKSVDGQLLTGKASKNEGTQFRSQAEVVRAMQDPKYDKDPAYRQDIYDKLERSKNITF